jgi:hypothetical protein
MLFTRLINFARGLFLFLPRAYNKAVQPVLPAFYPPRVMALRCLHAFMP